MDPYLDTLYSPQRQKKKAEKNNPLDTRNSNKINQ